MAAIYPHDMAFPVPQSEAPNNSYQWGLTKREYFAAMALQGLLSCPTRCATTSRIRQG
jgi:hypothetical protein